MLSWLSLIDWKQGNVGWHSNNIIKYWEFYLWVRTNSNDRCGACDCTPVKSVEGVGRRGGGFLVTGESPTVMISWDNRQPDGNLGQRGGIYIWRGSWWKGVPFLSFWELLVVIRLGTEGVCIEPRSLTWALEFKDRRVLWAETEFISGVQSLIHGTVLHHSSLTYTHMHTQQRIDSW